MDGFSIQTFSQVMKANKFKFEGGKEGEGSSTWYKLYEYQTIVNTKQYAMSEQQQLQNAIHTLQGIFNIYAPSRKYNPYILDNEEAE